MSYCPSDSELEEQIAERGDDVHGLLLWALSAMSYKCDSPRLHSIEEHNQIRRRWAEVLHELLKGQLA